MVLSAVKTRLGQTASRVADPSPLPARLQSRMTAVALLFAALVGLAGMAIAILSAMKLEERNRVIQTKIFAASLAPAMAMGDTIQAREIVIALLSDKSISAAWATNRHGLVIGSPPADFEAARAAFQNSAPSSSASRTSVDGFSAFSAPIQLNDQELGMAFISAGADLPGILWAWFLLIPAIALCGAALYSLRVRQVIQADLSPLAQLCDWARNSNSEDSVLDPPDIQAPPELALLSGKFRHSAGEIEKARDDQRKSRREVEFANHAKNEFLAQVSHELRTPMNGIMGTTDLLWSTPLNTEQRELLKTLQSSGGLLMGILSDLLDISSIDNNSMTLRPVVVDLLDLLTGTVENVRPIAAAKGLEIHFPSAPKKSIHVMADGQRLRQVFLNLLGNAVKFTSKGSILVQLSLTPINNDMLQMLLSVEDTGVGIQPQKIERIFDPFFQVDRSLRRKQGGIGLGLSISRQIIQKMGGDIIVSSRPEEGSTFSIQLQLPRATAPLKPRSDSDLPAEPATPPARLQVDASLKVLIAEDNKVNQRVLSLMLRRMGIDAAVVDNGREAVDYVAANPVDLILMDLQMPLMDGFEATKTIRSTMPPRQQPYIIAVTAHALPTDVSQCMVAGMQAHVAKPLKSEVLAELLKDLKISEWRSNFLR